MDCSLPGSSHPWNFPGKNTGVGCHFLKLDTIRGQREAALREHDRLNIWMLRMNSEITVAILSLSRQPARGVHWKQNTETENTNKSLETLCCFSVTQSCPTLRPHGLQHARLPVHHQLPELAQTYVHRVGDAISSSVVPFSYLQSIVYYWIKAQLTSGLFRCVNQWIHLFFLQGAQNVSFWNKAIQAKKILANNADNNDRFYHIASSNGRVFQNSIPHILTCRKIIWVSC